MTAVDGSPLVQALERLPQPLLVLSRHLGSLFAAEISHVTGGPYNHCMWYVGGGRVASQDWLWHVVPIERYLRGDHLLKFVLGARWNSVGRALMRKHMLRDLDAPWWRRLYDPLQVVGLRWGWPGLQLPGLQICSDRVSYLRYADHDYDLEHPTPEQVNAWTKTRSVEAGGQYRVVARYQPDGI